MPGLGGRMSTVIKSKISRMLDRAEDPSRDARLRLPEAGRAASERQEGHRRRRHVEEAPPDAVPEARAAGGQARHAGPPGAVAGPRGPGPRRARAQDRRPDRAPVARPAGHGAREPAGAADREREEAAHEDRGLPDEEGGHQGAVLRRRGAGEDLRGRQRRGRADGRRRPGDPARRGQDRADAGPRGGRRGARGRRHLRRPHAARPGRRTTSTASWRSSAPARRWTTSWRR